MDRTERFYKIDQLLREMTVVPTSVFLERLEVAPATFKRDLEYMRSRLNAPIEWDRDAGGYRLVTPVESAPKYELPGLWFNPSEIHALLTMQHLLANLQPGLLGPHIEPLLARLRALLGKADHSQEEIEQRIRILHMASRSARPEHFELVATALLRRQRLRIVYYGRANDEETERPVSPQRLVYYRDNWYLDAWCHLRKGLRSFSLDAIRRATMLPDPARELDLAELDDSVGSGYGIFSGRATHWAVLRFAPPRARWVSAESWHPRQVGRFEPDGSYVLEIPYSDSRELVMDILKHGPEVEVLAPPGLRAELRSLAERTAKIYAA